MLRVSVRLASAHVVNSPGASKLVRRGEFVGEIAVEQLLDLEFDLVG
jgi:hypothetical protein